MNETDRHTQRIEDLAVFLDPDAFERRRDFFLAKRRKAAWRNAVNRIGSSNLEV